MDVAALGIGSRIVPVLPLHVDVVPEDGDGTRTCSVTGVETRDTWPGTVNRPRMLATTATGVVTFPGTVRSPKGRESSSATPVGRPATWPVTAITPTSRNATPAAG